METTTQFNIRISKSLLWDLDYIAEHRKVSRNDWLRYMIAEMISTEVIRIKEATQREYAAGRVSEDQYEKKMGFKPPKELTDIRERALGYQKRYMESLLDEVKKEKKTSLTDQLSEREFSDIWDKIKKAPIKKHKTKKPKKPA